MLVVLANDAIKQFHKKLQEYLKKPKGFDLNLPESERAQSFEEVEQYFKKRMDAGSRHNPKYFDSIFCKLPSEISRLYSDLNKLEKRIALDFFAKSGAIVVEVTDDSDIYLGFDLSQVNIDQHT